MWQASHSGSCPPWYPWGPPTTALARAKFAVPAEKGSTQHLRCLRDQSPPPSVAVLRTNVHPFWLLSLVRPLGGTTIGTSSSAGPCVWLYNSAFHLAAENGAVFQQYNPASRVVIGTVISVWAVQDLGRRCCRRLYEIAGLLVYRLCPALLDSDTPRSVF